jgi:Base plate wedge protein 53
MGQLFDYFPLVPYDIAQNQYSNYQSVTNILFRMRVVHEIIHNISSYYPYIIRDDDRPDTLADKVYKNAEAHWIILYANDMVDPQYDWPLTTKDFIAYMTDKYGSTANAKTTIHHYDMVIKRENTDLNVIDITRYQVNEANVASNLNSTLVNVPYDTYENLTETQAVATHNIDGRTVIETIYREAVTYWDYENNLNEEKRRIKIIKPEYYPVILSQFNQLTQNATNPGLRTLF